MKKADLILGTIGKMAYVCLCAVLCMFAVASCSNDDEEDATNAEGTSSFENPKYESQAAKFVMNGSDSPYESVEFTESGNYIITRNGVGGYVAAQAKAVRRAKGRLPLMGSNMLKRSMGGVTRGETVYSPILYGKYTKAGDNTYVLEGYGTVEVNTDENGNAVSLTMIPTGGDAVTYTATKQNRDQNSSNSNSLCRTWGISGIRYYLKYNGITYVDIYGDSFEELYANMKAWLQENDPDYDESEWGEEDFSDEPEQVVFTKSGTYMVLYKDSQLAVSTWRWYNEEETVLQYSWRNDFDIDYEDNGFVDISFANNQLVMTEKAVYSEGGITEEAGWIYYLSEVK